MRKMYQVGRYVAVVYDRDWYIGLIDEKDGDEYTINYMHPKNPRGTVHWPARKDSCLTPAKNILCEIQVPACSTNTARGFSLQEKEYTAIEQLFNNSFADL